MASSVFPLTIGLRHWKTLDKPLRYFTLFLLLTVLQIGLEYYLGRIKASTHLLSDYYRSIEVTFLLLLFRQFILPQIKNRIVFSFLAFYFCLWLVVSQYFYTPDHLNIPMAVTARILLVSCAMIVLYSLVHKTSAFLIPIYKQYIFWIAIGVLTYCTGTFMVLSLGNEILKYGADYFIAMWHINWTFFILSNMFFSWSFIVATK